MPEFCAVGAPISLTHPARAAHSASAVSTIPSFRFNADPIIAALSYGAKPEPQAPQSGSGETSIFRNDWPAEFVVQAHRHHRIGTLGGIGKLAVRRERVTGAVVAVEIVIAVFKLPDHVVGQRVCETSTRGQAVRMNRELIDSEYRIGIGMNQIAKGPTASEEHQPAVDGETTSRTKRAAPAKVVRIHRGNRK